MFFQVPSNSREHLYLLVNRFTNRFHMTLKLTLRPCAHESRSARLRSQTGTDRPTAHTGSNLSAPVWLRYPYQRGMDKKNGAVWLRSIWLPCELTDWIQKRVQIGNEANFVYKRGLSTFCILAHGFVECRR